MPIDVLTDRIPMSQRERDVLKACTPCKAASGPRRRRPGCSAWASARSDAYSASSRPAATPPSSTACAAGPPTIDPTRPSAGPCSRPTAGATPTSAPPWPARSWPRSCLAVGPQTLRRWLIAEGLWQCRRRRDPHRSRRPRCACFGELVQMDASIHDWLEGRGEEMVLISMIDDATNRIQARFYPSGTVETHLDLLGRWLRRHGRPLALYTDRHSIFEPQDKGRALPEAETQFGRALRELGVELIRAQQPAGQGALRGAPSGPPRTAGSRNCVWRGWQRAAANELLERLLPGHNRRFGKPAREAGDAHRPLGPGHDLGAILSIQEERVVANDYTIRFRNRFYQLLPPVHPGQRGGRVVVELRLDGSMAIRFRAST